MTYKIGVVAEEKSDVQVFDEILKKYISENKYVLKKKVGNGCGKMRRKFCAWSKIFISERCHHIFLIHDRDRNDENKLRNELEQLVVKTGFRNSVVIIPVQEIEAWLLSDENAIKKVFNISKKLKINRRVEKIDSPKEYLRDVVRNTSNKTYLNTVHNVKIAAYCSLENLNRCSSFQFLDQYINDNFKSHRIA